jgi:hypothetical protein
MAFSWNSFAAWTAGYDWCQGSQIKWQNGMAYQMLFASENACDFISFRSTAVVRV